MRHRDVPVAANKKWFAPLRVDYLVGNAECFKNAPRGKPFAASRVVMKV